jgi:hypothetical protein
MTVKVLDVEVTAASSQVAAKKTKEQLKEERTNRVKKYRWTKGQSGNPDGARMKLPMSDTLRLLSQMALPEPFRVQLEDALGGKLKLPKDMTFLDGLTFGQLCAPFAPNVLKGFDTVRLKDLREAIEGKSALRISIPGEELLAATGDESVDIRDRIMLSVLNMMKRRSELYDLKVPRMEELESAAIDEMAKRKTG